MSDLEVLVATMNQENINKYYEMNIKTDVVLANQANSHTFLEKEIEGNKVKMITTNDRGVGKNRNQALIASSAKICLISDDDVVYNDNYEKVVKDAFEKIPKADIIIFNIETIGGNIERRINTKIKRVNLLNFQNYGAVRIAFRRDKIMQANIWFSTLFGGGSRYSAGEDTLFLREALRKKLKIYTYPKSIGKVDQQTSTWFNGYNEKLFFDKGALLSNAFPILKYLFAIFYFSWRFSKKTDITKRKTIKLMISGIRNFKRGISYEEWKKQNEK